MRTILLYIVLVLFVSTVHAQNEIVVKTAYPIFEKLLANPQDEHLWSAIYDYWKTADGIKAELFWCDCYLALKMNPLFFYQRYVKGDDKALELMLNAFNCDCLVFFKKTKDDVITKADARRVLERAISQIENMKSNNSTRHEHFLDESKNALTQWDEDYKNEP